VFAWLQQHGKVDAAEMARTFNCGIGMVVIVASDDAAIAEAHLRASGESVFSIGEVRVRAPGDAQTIIV
jgi:phosphoribosylformylglycinamidine cyclo-ligase